MSSFVWKQNVGCFLTLDLLLSSLGSSPCLMIGTYLTKNHCRSMSTSMTSTESNKTFWTLSRPTQSNENQTERGPALFWALLYCICDYGVGRVLRHGSIATHTCRMSYGVFLKCYFGKWTLQGSREIIGIIGTTSNAVMYLSIRFLFALLTRRWAHKRQTSSLRCCAHLYQLPPREDTDIIYWRMTTIPEVLKSDPATRKHDRL